MDKTAHSSLDDDIEMFLAPASGRTYTERDVIANISDSFNRKLLPETEEQRLGDIWKDRLHTNPRLWDGSKFRIEAAKVENGKAVLNLGVTGYKDFLCTNFSPRVAELRELGKTNHGDHHAHLAHPLGVGALVQTTDDYFVLLKRSDFCGEAVGKLDVPGGHPEPEELVGKIPAPDIEVKTFSERDVVHEIFDSIHREICDEVNLPKAKVTFPELLGIVRNTPSSGRPTAEFISRCSLSSSDVKALYEEGTQPDAEETTNIMFVPMAAILNMDTSCEYSPIWAQLTASAKGAVSLFRMTSLVDKYIGQT